MERAIENKKVYELAGVRSRYYRKAMDKGRGNYYIGILARINMLDPNKKRGYFEKESSHLKPHKIRIIGRSRLGCLY